MIEMVNGEEKKVQNLNVGEILKGNIKITGIVKSLDHKKTFNYLNKSFDVKGNNIMFEKNNLANYDKKYVKKTGNGEYLYHIITDKKHFYVNDVKIFDYNSCLEHFLNH